MRVLVAGGAGFLGSHLCDALLERGDEVVCVDNFVTGSTHNVAHLAGHDAFRLVDHDICAPLPDSLEAPVDAIMNLASPASPKDYLAEPIATLEVGSTGTRNMLELARRHDARFFMASTSEVYGDPLVHPQPESYWGHVNPIGERSVYDEAKRFSEALTAAYRRTHGVDTRIVRIFNTYGPRMQVDDGRVVSNFIVQALRGEPLTIYGDGGQTRSFCYVSDEVDGIYRLFHSDRVAPTNIGNPHEFTIRELADIVLEETGSASKLETLPLPSDDPKVRKPDITIAREVLGWEPQVQLREGIRRTIPYFREQLEQHDARARTI